MKEVVLSVYQDREWVDVVCTNSLVIGKDEIKSKAKEDGTRKTADI